MDPVLDELLALAERDGGLTPARVVEKAANPKSPLHKHFTWDDSEAAHKYRLIEAGKLIRRFTITRQDTPAGPPRRIHIFHDVTGQFEGEKRYVSLDRLERDPGMWEVALENARREMQRMTVRYKELDLLALAGEVWGPDGDDTSTYLEEVTNGN